MSSDSRPIYKTVLFKITATLLILYCIVWALSSPLIKYFAKEPLADMGLVLSDSSKIIYNPFLTRVTVSNLSLLKEEQTVLSSKHVALQLALHKLFIDKVVIEEFTVDGVTLEIEKEADKLIVAGVQITPKSSDEKTIKENDEAVDVSKEPLPYQVLLDALVLTNTNVNVLLEKQRHQLVINELVVNNIQATESEQSASLTLQSLIDSAPLNITANLHLKNGDGGIKSDIQISEYPLTKIKHLIEPLNQLTGTLSFSSEQVLNIVNNTLNIDIIKAELLNKKLLVNTNQNTVNLDDLTLNVNDIKLSIVDNALADVKGLAQLSLTKLNVTGETTQQQILTLSQLNIKNIAPNLPKNNNGSLETEQLPVTAIESLTIHDLLFSQNKTTDLPAVATIKEISILDVVAAIDSIAIDTINIDSITSHIILNKEKALANLVALSSKEVESEAPVTEPSEPTSENESAPFKITLNAFNVINNNQIDFIDNSVDPIYERSLMIDELSVGAISNTSTLKENNTPITLVGRSNEYANFAFNGFIKPFAQQQTYSIKGQLKELSLPAASTYMKDALDLELTSGQLNTDLDVTLIDEDIDGEIKFNIKGLETGSVDSVKNDSITDQISIPFNTALSLLKDNNGNVELDIPLSGKTSDPSFGINSLISLVTKKAIVSATKVYLLKTIVPIGNVASVAMIAGDFILKERFDDLTYQPTQLNVNATQNEYISTFVMLMKEKKETQVKICAVSTPADIGLQANVELSENDIKKLKYIGNQREKHFKAKAVKEGVESGRILLCTPQIDSGKDSLPRIAISV